MAIAKTLSSGTDKGDCPPCGFCVSPFVVKPYRQERSARKIRVRPWIGDPASLLSVSTYQRPAGRSRVDGSKIAHMRVGTLGGELNHRSDIQEGRSHYSDMQNYTLEFSINYRTSKNGKGRFTGLRGWDFCSFQICQGVRGNFLIWKNGLHWRYHDLGNRLPLDVSTRFISNGR
jgi:hypothetical protein